MLTDTTTTNSQNRTELSARSIIFFNFQTSYLVYELATKMTTTMTARTKIINENQQK